MKSIVSSTGSFEETRLWTLDGWCFDPKVSLMLAPSRPSISVLIIRCGQGRWNVALVESIRKKSKTNKLFLSSIVFSTGSDKKYARTITYLRERSIWARDNSLVGLDTKPPARTRQRKKIVYMLKPPKPHHANSAVVLLVYVGYIFCWCENNSKGNMTDMESWWNDGLRSDGSYTIILVP